MRAGGLVGLPTETVYGLAADAENATAIARVFAVKGRPADHPLIVHLADTSQLDDWVANIPASAQALADAAWPGPLTLLLPRGKRVLDVVTGGRATVAVRVPAHPLTLDVLRRFGRPVVAPSANRFGHVSPTTAEHVVADLADALDPTTDVVLDGGPSPVGIESTIVDCTATPPQILRPGGIPSDDVEAIIGSVDAVSGPSRASGMLASHYAPSAAVELVEDAGVARRRHTELTAAGAAVAVVDVSDLVVYASTLYARLRQADIDGVDVVLAVMPPAVGLGHAIRDRLTKAAAR